MSAGEWIELLRAERDRVGGATTGRRIGYSEAVVSAVLNGSYKGDLSRVQKAVEGALGGAEVDCPVIGSLPRQACIKHQRSRFKSTNPLAVQLHRTCPECPNGGKRS